MPSKHEERFPPQRGSSAFSRLANIALSSSTSTTGSTSTSSSPASAPIPATLSTTSSDRSRGALDALEHIANADQTRKRHGSTDSRLDNLAPTQPGGPNANPLPPSSSSSNFPLHPNATSTRFPSPYYGTKRASWSTNRDSSESRSRERERSDASSSLGFVASGGQGPGGFNDSPGGGGGGVYSSTRTGGGNGYWGMEALPTNASYSAVSSYAGGGGFYSTAPGEQHYFQPGAGSSGFSFEANSSNAGAGGGPYWDGSYRSSVTGSSSLFGPSSRSQGSTNFADRSSSDESRLGSQPWDLPTASPSPLHSRAHSPNVRTSSPMGGGRKPKDSSRGVRYTVASTSREKGLVGLAKPPKDSGELGRVAVAGKTSLKILKVPYGPSTRRTLAPPTATSHHHRSTSIADRRSRSRGRAPAVSPVGSNRRAESSDAGGTDSGGDDPSEVQVTELQDVRIGSRLGPSYLFADVRWGYGATSTKLATACTNGAVVLWDLAKEGGAKLDQVKYEHDRAVNRVVFGGQTGNWLMSGGQDGQMKLWDIRESRPSSMVLKASSPVRHLSFSPSASQPFTLLAACASGTLIRYDVRYISRQNGGATDRIAGHIGSCLAMDWRDGFDCERIPGSGGGGGPQVGVSQETAGGGREGGWVVTGGSDSTIKIWDFSLSTLSTKAVRTLYPSQPVQSVSWHPTNGTELASAPLPSLSLGADSSPSEETTPTTPVSTDNPMNAFLRGDSYGSGRGSSWKNEIAVWDTRRPYFPKMAIKTDEPTSAIIFNDDETIWSTSKTTSTFHQYDSASDSYSLLDSIDRPAIAWNLDGDFTFIDDSRTQYDVPFERSTRRTIPVDTAKFVPEVFFASVAGLDPDYSAETFTELANNLRIEGDFDDVCDHNAHASFMAGRPDAAQIWATIRTWFGSAPFSTPNSPPLTPPPNVEDEEKLDSPSTKAPLAEWILSPTSVTHSEAAAKSHRGQRFSISSMKNSPTSRRQGSDDTYTSAPPKDAVKQLLDTFSEESTASETDPSTQSPFYPEVVSTSSDSEQEPRIRSRGFNSASIASLPTNRLAASLAALADAQSDHDSSSNASLDEVHVKPSRTPSRLQSRRNSTSSSSSESSGSDLDNNGEERGGSVATRRSRSAKIAALHASLIANRSRRPSAGQSSERRPLRSRDSTLAGVRAASRQQSAEGTGDSRRASAARNAGSRLASVMVPPTKKDTKDWPATTSKELNRQASSQYASDAFEVVKRQLKDTLRDYADRGDSQLCAVVCCVLQDRDLDFDSLWIARITKAYLDLLRKLNLHVAAAMLNKYCATESLRSLTQDSVVFHTACGRCGKGIEQAPFNFCSRCSSQITKCCICHLAATTLYLFCACCGHGMHESCLQAFTTSFGNLVGGRSQPQTPVTASIPSTPGLIATPLRAWLWGEPLSPVVDNDDDLDGMAVADRIASLVQCPSGFCSHACMVPSQFSL